MLLSFARQRLNKIKHKLTMVLSMMSELKPCKFQKEGFGEEGGKRELLYVSVPSATPLWQSGFSTEVGSQCCRSRGVAKERQEELECKTRWVSSVGFSKIASHSSHVHSVFLLFITMNMNILSTCILTLGASVNCCFHTRLVEGILEGGGYGSVLSDTFHLLPFASELLWHSLAYLHLTLFFSHCARTVHYQNVTINGFVSRELKWVDAGCQPELKTKQFWNCLSNFPLSNVGTN